MTQTDLQAGAVLGGYEVERELGRGALGIVYLARHLHLGRSAALKVMHPYWTASDEFSKRFREEARLLALLEHPSILRVYDAGEIDGVFYIATQYLEGRTLEELLQRTVPLQATLLIAQQLASALAYAHRAGVIHRDVKPANVMVSPYGTVTLMDFGVARFADSPAMTMPGVQVGTPFYMAPELIFGRRADARSDVYALGVVLHQVLSGAPPFPGPDTETVFRGHLNEPPPELAPEIPDWVKQVIGRALAKKPEERFQTADDLLAAIRAGVRSGEIAPPDTGVLLAPPARADAPAPADSSEPVPAPPSAGTAAAPDGETPSKASGTAESPPAAPQARPSEAAPAPGTGSPGVSMVRHYRTVLSLDIAGSSFMKQPGLTLAVHHKFALFREYVRDRLEEYRVLQYAWAGDGLMALFERPADGGLCARAILDDLEAFNKKQGGEPIRVRLGVHTGPILMDANQPLGEITSSTLDIAGHLQKHSGEDSILASERIFAALENPQSWQPAGPEFNLAFSTPIYRYTLKDGPFPSAPSVARIAPPAATTPTGTTPSRAAASGPLELSRLIDELMETAASEARGPDSLTLLAPHDETAPSPWEADLESMPEGTPPIPERSGRRVSGVAAIPSARTSPSSGSSAGQEGDSPAAPTPASSGKKTPLPPSENAVPAKSGTPTPGPARPAENRGTYSLRSSGPGASGADAIPPAEVRLRLEIRTGPRVEVREVLGTTLFGRPDPGASPGPKIEIVDDDAISRRHARIRLDQGRFVLEDLESANGTNLNGDWIEPLQPRPLYPGDEIQMGEHTTIRILAR